MADDDLMQRNLTVAQMHEDVDAFIEQAIATHPDMASYANISALKAAGQTLKLAINEPMNRVKFYRYVGRLSHQFNDGHSFLIWPYQEYNLLKEQGTLFFPFDVAIAPTGEVRVKQNYKSTNNTLAAGTEILSINGVDTSELVASMQEYVGGETAYLRQQIVARRFSLGLWAVFDFVDEFSMVIQSGDSEVNLNVSSEHNWLAAKADEFAQQEHYYRQLSPEVGHLYLAHFDIEPSEFEDFIDDSFATIKKQGIKHLLIDIRDNPGGNTDTVTYLTQYIANKPFRLVSQVREKLNAENRGWFNYKGEVGEVLEQDWDDWYQPTSNENRFSGETYLAVGAISYSAAIVLATTLQDNDFATLLGEATGGFANQTAQGNLFNLPNSQLRAYVATRLLVRPSGDIQRQPVIPDFELLQTSADLIQEKDVVLDWLMKKVK